MTEKKKGDYFANFFNKKPKPTNNETKQQLPFDENYFDLIVTGGSIHSTPIEVKGVARTNKEELKLKCIWFLISSHNDVSSLTTVTGQTYQPSIDDVGFRQFIDHDKIRIMVQAEPVIEGQVYEGMPKSQEVGPLTMDQHVQDDTAELLEAEQLTVLVKLIEVPKAEENEGETQFSTLTDCVVILQVNLKEMKLQFKQADEIVRNITRTLDTDYPCCRSVRNSSNQFYLLWDPQTEFIMQADDNIQRDIIQVVVTSFYGKNLCADKSAGSSISSVRGSLVLQDQQIKSVVDTYHASQEVSEREDQEEDQDQENTQEQESPEKSPEKEDVITEPVEEQEQQQDSASTPEQTKEDAPPQPILETQSSDFQSTLNQWRERVQSVVKPTDKTQTKEPKPQQQTTEPSKNIEKTPTKEPQQSVSASKSEIVCEKEEASSRSEDAESKKQSKESKKQKVNVEYFMMVNENAKLKQERDNLTSQLTKSNEVNKTLEKKVKELNDQLATCTKNYYDMRSTCEKHERTIEQLNDLKVFLQSVLIQKTYQKDIQIYKGQNHEIQEELNSLKEELATFQKRMRRQTINQDLQSLKEQYSQLDKQLLAKEGEIASITNQLASERLKIEELEGVIESVQNQLISERKKSESLAQEKGLKYGGPRENDDDDPQKLENTRLKQQISNLEATLRSLKFAYDQDVRFSVYNTKLKKNAQQNQNQDWKQLQHLANNLSEIITEKEIALENQTQINRELMKRLQILQDQR